MSIITIDIEKLEFLEECPSLDHIPALAESIKEDGLLHEILVAESGKEGKYVIISGIRRVEACKMLGMKEVPCKIIEVEPGKELETRKRFNMKFY